MRLGVLLIVVAIGSACIPVAIGQPEWAANRRPLPPCGVERLSRDGGVDRDARRCLLAAWEAGEEAELISARTTVEGDLVTRYLRVHGNGTIEVFVDATQDAYGSGQWERHRCEALVPATPGDESDVFTEEGCEPLPVP